jgi:hypothetical protein
MKQAYTIVLALLISAPCLASAADQQGVERLQPLQELTLTEVVYTQEKGELQLSLASVFDNGRGRDSITIPLSVEYGLTDRWQVGLEWSSITHQRFIGRALTETGGFSIGTKYSFMNIGGSQTHAAVGVEAGMAKRFEPDASSERGREVETFAAFATEFNQRGAQVFGHVGWGFEAAGDGDGEIEKELQLNAGALLPTGSVTWAVELNLRNESFSVRDAHELYVTPSITFTRRGRWEFGVGAPVGLTLESNRLGLAVQMSYER